MEEQEMTIDLVEIANIVKRHCRQIAKITAGCIVLACLYLLIAKPVYESNTLLQIKAQQGLASSLLNGPEGISVAMIQQRMSTFAQVLTSRGVVEPVMEQEAKETGEQELTYESYVKRISAPNRQLNIPG